MMAQEIEDSTSVLMGLRFSSDQSKNLFRNYIMHLEESVVYQELVGIGVEQGLKQGLTQRRITQAREFITRKGTKRFGKPTAYQLQQLESCSNLVTLELLMENVTEVTSWDQLLSTM